MLTYTWSFLEIPETGTKPSGILVIWCRFTRVADSNNFQILLLLVLPYRVYQKQVIPSMILKPCNLHHFTFKTPISSHFPNPSWPRNHPTQLLKNSINFPPAFLVTLTLARRCGSTGGKTLRSKSGTSGSPCRGWNGHLLLFFFWEKTLGN